MLSLGKVVRSTRSTRYPLRASNMAVGEPAQRAPTMIASYIVYLCSRHQDQTGSNKGTKKALIGRLKHVLCRTFSVVTSLATIGVPSAMIMLSTSSIAQPTPCSGCVSTHSMAKITLCHVAVTIVIPTPTIRIVAFIVMHHTGFPFKQTCFAIAQR